MRYSARCWDTGFSVQFSVQKYKSKVVTLIRMWRITSDHNSPPPPHFLPEILENVTSPVTIYTPVVFCRFSRPVGRLFRSNSTRPQTATISHLEVCTSYFLSCLENLFLFLEAKSKNKNFLCKSNIKLPAYADFLESMVPHIVINLQLKTIFKQQVNYMAFQYIIWEKFPSHSEVDERTGDEC